MMRTNKYLLFLIPLFTVITLGLGLRIGAERTVRAARLHAAPPPAHLNVLAWQLFTYENQRDLYEAVAIANLTATARAHGEQVTWQGASSVHGIAEMRFPFQTLDPNETVSIEVRIQNDPIPLLTDDVRLSSLRSDANDAPSLRFVRPLLREGDLHIDVVPLDGQLATGFHSRVFARVTDASGRPVPRIAISLNPDPGVTTPASATTCDTGWAEFEASAVMHAIQIELNVESADKKLTGKWVGPLPVAAGASDVHFSRTPPANKPFHVAIDASNARSEVFAEINDANGRIFAGEFLFQTVDGRKVASFEAPALPPGNYWLVASGTPEGTENAAHPGSLSHPFFVHEGALPSCSIVERLASFQKTHFPRKTVSDSLSARHAQDRKNKSLGIAIAIIGLIAGALLETLLLLRGVGRATTELSNASESPEESRALGNSGKESMRVVVGVLITLLGFALFTAIVLWASR